MDVFFRHNPVLMWLEKRGWYRGDAFPGTSFALQRIWEREHQKSTQESADRREDLLDKFRRANRERPEYITDREVLGISLTLLIAGAETRLDSSCLAPIHETDTYTEIILLRTAQSL